MSKDSCFIGKDPKNQEDEQTSDKVDLFVFNTVAGSGSFATTPAAFL